MACARPRQPYPAHIVVPGSARGGMTQVAQWLDENHNFSNRSTSIHRLRTYNSVKWTIIYTALVLTLVRSMCFRNEWPRPLSSDAPSMIPVLSDTMKHEKLTSHA